MAIEWVKKVVTDGKETWVDDGVTHVGLVMGSRYTREERVMSDVYADVSYVTVWDPEAGRPTEVALRYHFELNTRTGTPTADIDPAIKAAWDAKVAAGEAQRAAAAKTRRAQEREDDAREELLAIRKGATAVVVKGRKVPRGTRGVIVWTGDGNYGPRVGLKDASGIAHWTAASNVKVVLPDMGPDDVPEGGWVALRDRMREVRHEWAKSFPRKGNAVRHLESGLECKVFWQKDERLGVKRKGAAKDDEVIWCNAWEVAVIESDGTERNVTKAAPTVDYKVIVKGRSAPKRPEGFTDMGLGDAPAPTPPGLAAMPAPYCNIRTVREEGDGTFTALDGGGNVLLKLPAGSAAKISALLAG